MGVGAVIQAPVAQSTPVVQGGGPTPTMQEVLAQLATATAGLQAVLDGAATSGAGATTGGGPTGACGCADTSGGGDVATPVEPTPTEPAPAPPPTPAAPTDGAQPAPPEAPPVPPAAPAAPAAPATTGGGPANATFPLAGGQPHRDDGFGATEGRKRPHGGVDITVPGGSNGKPILAMGAGKVVESGPNGGWGNTIVIDHGNGYFTRYAHMLEVSPHGVGAQVTAGQEIGKVGSTGESTGPHLHVEVLKGGTAIANRVDPMPFLDGTTPLG